MNTPKQEKRYEEVHEKAMRRFCDKMDFDPCEWLDKKEQREYLKLQNEE